MVTYIYGQNAMCVTTIVAWHIDTLVHHYCHSTHNAVSRHLTCSYDLIQIETYFSSSLLMAFNKNKQANGVFFLKVTSNCNSVLDEMQRMETCTELPVGKGAETICWPISRFACTQMCMDLITICLKIGLIIN